MLFRSLESVHGLQPPGCGVHLAALSRVLFASTLFVTNDGEWEVRSGLQCKAYAAIRAACNKNDFLGNGHDCMASEVKGVIVTMQYDFKADLDGSAAGRVKPPRKLLALISLSGD